MNDDTSDPVTVDSTHEHECQTCPPSLEEATQLEGRTDRSS
ncbi:hypothetical protein ACFOZ7_22480 [Natribaculum luteum]|uniref:Uncharacterized protein n=1 Tax=Natribaculum luteum TaxID=1586232 RepID=A0ABD5P6A9_9EURY|nr:hypothetical protein [Natribaculum luteum]